MDNVRLSPLHTCFLLPLLSAAMLAIGCNGPGPTKPSAASQPAAADPSGLARLFKDLQAGKKRTLVAWGTSLTAMSHEWVDKIDQYMKANYPGQVTVINSGISASCSKMQGLPLLQSAVLDKKPDVVFIEFAINDAYLPYATSLEDCRRNTNEMIDRILQARPECVIVLQTMNPCFGTEFRKRPNLAAYYQVYRDVARERKVELIDHYVVWQEFLVKHNDLFEKYVPDTIHPVGEGNTVVIWQTIQAAFETARAKAGRKSGE